MMISKNEVKYIQSLCHKKQRQQDGLFIAEGPKIVEELLHSNYTIRKLFAVKEWLAANPLQSIDTTEIGTAELERISSLQTPNQVLALVQAKAATEPELKGRLGLVLDGIQDPGNLGTIIRIADWFGIREIICSADTAELYNPKVVQSTMGSFIRVNVWYGDVKVLLDANKNLPVYGTLLQGKSIYTIDKPKEGLLIIGNEGRGIREDIISYIQHPITIPRIGGAESLNAAVATGIVLSHFV